MLYSGRCHSGYGQSGPDPDEDHIKEALGAVFYHALEVGTVVCLGRQSAVNITADNGDVILLSVGRTLTELALNTLLSLIVAGIPSVNDRFHFPASPNIS